MKKINILGYNFVISKKYTSHQLGSLGDIDLNKQVIRVAREVCPELKETTILHEIIESLNYIQNMKLSHTNIEKLELGLFSTLKNNKEFFRKFLE